MSDLYSEWLVKRETPKYTMAVKLLIFCAMLISFTLSILMLSVIPFIISAGFGVLFYFYATGVNVEYEYIYVNGELDIDVIKNRTRRKKCISFDMAHLEIMAPEDSYLLDSYRNKTCKTYDFTSGVKNAAGRYVIYGTDKNEMIKIIFEPNEKIVNEMRYNSPRKVNL